MFTKNDESQSEMDWDFYFYVGKTLLGLSLEEFWNITPAHLLKQFIMHLKFTNPKSLKEEKKIYTLDQTPFR